MERESLAERMHRWGDAFDRRDKERWREAKRQAKHEVRRSGYAFAILANLAILWAVSNLLEWDLGFVEGSFVVVLPFLQASLLAQAAANFCFVFYDESWFVHLAKVALNLFSVFVTYILYSIYPFHFGPWDALARLGLVFVMVAIGIALIVELVQLLFDLNRLIFARD